jgi:anti-sigma B factor antagonist
VADDPARELGARELVEQPVPGSALVRVTGEVDYFTADDWHDVIAEGLAQEPRRLVVDLAEVEFFGSPGLAVLVQARFRAQQQRTEIVLVCSSPRVRRVLELTGLLDLFTVTTSAEEALRERPWPESLPDAARGVRTPEAAVKVSPGRGPPVDVFSLALETDKRDQSPPARPGQWFSSGQGSHLWGLQVACEAPSTPARPSCRAKVAQASRSSQPSELARIARSRHSLPSGRGTSARSASSG